MKKFKAIKILSILVISLFIINVNVKAFENDYKLTEDDLYYFTNKNNIDLELNPNIFCYFLDGTMNCFFFSDDILKNIVVSEGYSGPIIENKIDLNLTRYSFPSIDAIFLYKNSKIQLYITGSQSIFTNIDKIYNSITYDKIYKLNISTSEEPKELEITATGTEILTSILDKTKNIYEVLIANQLFVLCSCILLSYLVFIILHKTIRK